MPGSPVEVKIQTRSSPPNMPPLPPVNPGGPRPVSFTPAARKPPLNHFVQGLARRRGALLVPASGRAPCLPGCWPAQSCAAGSEGWGFPSAYVGRTMGSVQPCPFLLCPSVVTVFPSPSPCRCRCDFCNNLLKAFIRLASKKPGAELCAVSGRVNSHSAVSRFADSVSAAEIRKFSSFNFTALEISHCLSKFSVLHLCSITSPVKLQGAAQRQLTRWDGCSAPPRRRDTGSCFFLSETI